MKLLERVAAPPAAAWPWLADPKLISEWSTAPVRALLPGDGGEPWGVGALREVLVPAFWLKIRLREVIESSDPPERLTYRVLGHPAIRHHRGEVRLRRVREGTSIEWDVEFVLVVQSLHRPVEKFLTRAMRRSLTALKQRVQGKPEQQWDSCAAVEDVAVLPALEAAAQAALVEQRALAAEQSAAGDPKQWFTRVYVLVTESQLERCRQGDLAHPGWVLRLIPRFHQHYIVTLQRGLGQAPGWVEEHWQHAFRCMEARPLGPDGAARVLLTGLRAGIRAHIEEDLPRTLAEIWARYYAHRCQFERFRADYMLMESVFHRASTAFIAGLPRGALPLRVRALWRVLPEPIEQMWRMSGSRLSACEPSSAVLLSLACSRRHTQPTQSAIFIPVWMVSS